jgi:hypothetical protein
VKGGAVGIFSKLFGSREVSLRELKLAHLSHERKRRRAAEELRKLEDRKSAVVERARQMRRAGDQLEVDHLWNELKQLRAESDLHRHDARILNLETIALKRTIHGLERLEAANDKAGVRNLLRRVRESGLDDKLAAGALRDEEYLRELEAILDETGAAAEVATDDDPEKAAFLAELDALNAAGESGTAPAPARRAPEIDEPPAALEEEREP